MVRKMHWHLTKESGQSYGAQIKMLDSPSPVWHRNPAGVLYPTQPEPALFTALQSFPGIIPPTTTSTTSTPTHPWLVPGTGSSVRSSTGGRLRQAVCQTLPRKLPDFHVPWIILPRLQGFSFATFNDDGASAHPCCQLLPQRHPATLSC